MNHLCYIYIYDYRCLHDVDLVIDSRYDYSFNREQMNLTVSSAAHPLPEKFWGTGVWSLTGIFGNNGAGKTTAIRFLLDVVVDGNSINEVNGIVVYECNGELRVYHNKDYEKQKSLTVSVNGDKKNHLVKNARLPKIETFFYMGHFSPEFSYNDLCTVGLKGLYNASEGFRLRNDIEKFANMSDPYLVKPISTYLVSHISQNNYRICRLLINKDLRSVFKSFSFPQYLFIAPNRGGQDNLKLNELIEKKAQHLSSILTPHPIRSIVPTRNEQLSYFMHFNLLNVYADNPIFANHHQVVKDWYEFVDTSKDVLEQFKEFAAKQNAEAKRFLLCIYEVLNLINTICHYNEDTAAFYLDIVKEEESVNRLMTEILSNDIFLTSRYFDMYYGRDVDFTSSTLCSGEQAMLNLFSRIYDAIELQPLNYGNIKSPTLLLLDEAELGFHPEWQRTYIETLLDFVHALKVVAGVNYQIVITSHSPILLSDLPVNCCNFLRKDENEPTINDREKQPQTYASNVFELYRNSFFLRNGLIGSFAEKRLDRLIKDIESGKDGVETEIALIGDERLRAYIASLYAKNNKAAAIRYYKEQLKQLGEDLK